MRPGSFTSRLRFVMRSIAKWVRGWVRHARRPSRLNNGFVVDALEPRRLLFASVMVPDPRGLFGDQFDTPQLTVSAGDLFMSDPGAAHVVEITPDGRVT